MRGVFEDKEEQERSHQRRDTELTLGSGMLLAIFFGLVVLCGLCFGLGYSVGHHNTESSGLTTPQPAPDQEPLQATGTIPKPSAIAQTPETPPDQPAADPTAAPDAAPTQTDAPQPGTPQTGPEAEVHPALASEGPAQPSAAAVPEAVRPALASQPLVVQVAAVSNPEDADVLVAALRKRNYPVTVRRDPADDYIHVRVGPFATLAIAEQWKTRLLNDGYNAVIQP